MCSIQDILDLFFLPESRATGLFAAKTEHNWMVNKCNRNSTLRMYFKVHAASKGRQERFTPVTLLKRAKERKSKERKSDCSF